MPPVATARGESPGARSSCLSGQHGDPEGSRTNDGHPVERAGYCVLGSTRPASDEGRRRTPGTAPARPARTLVAVRGGRGGFPGVASNSSAEWSCESSNSSFFHQGLCGPRHRGVTVCRRSRPGISCLPDGRAASAPRGPPLCCVRRDSCYRTAPAQPHME